MARIVYFRVSDPSYPRNSRIRAAINAYPSLHVSMIGREREVGRVVGILREYQQLWKESQGATAIILAEFSNSQALVTRVVAWLRGARFIVDGFIGLHETAVLDWKRYSPRSFRAIRLRLLDWIAVRCSDVYLIDTTMRAEAIRRKYRIDRTERVQAIPVGAPDWATWSRPTRAKGMPLRLLYYGNYIPLHGVPLFLKGLSLAKCDWRLKMIGDGPSREAIKRLAMDLGVDKRVTFLDPVPEADLLPMIQQSDVVLGVFGNSPKATSVVANKVWQGLACGRHVLTQGSAAIEELRPIVGGLLVATEQGSATSIARELDHFADTFNTATSSPQVTTLLTDFVNDALSHFVEELAITDRRAN